MAFWAKPRALWHSPRLDMKRLLLKLAFPAGLRYSHENGRF